jgi:cell division protein FtsQ
VKRAEIARRLPDVIFVRVEERAPLALWQHDGQIVLIDTDGAVIQRDELGEFARLPMVVGEDAPAHAAELIGLLGTFPEIAGKLEAAVRVSARRWNLRLNNGIDVRLPETGLAPALARLDDLQREKDILDRDVIAVDLRVPDRLIVRIDPEAAPRVHQIGKDT